eukprot:gnl/MRDRNA2_/MRDRNA2_98759_c0_seq1.p1 gnl/MRDRNA2_/MRDRNA2_98759_c0~~gnl/MRDRNA2_/MRDRNA2_98759_c0_seq1.p1  ORF type:complete len:599 (-),score=120.45 gnl/MRDRNA2_/MRDRNA2_98759_c0_seq1:141-1937(-)
MRITVVLCMYWASSSLGIDGAPHDRSCIGSLDSSGPSVCDMDGLDPPDEKPPGESALLQQVTVQMRKPFEPDDNLPEDTMVLELLDEHSATKKGQPGTSPETVSKSNKESPQRKDPEKDGSHVTASAEPHMAHQNIVHSFSDPAELFGSRNRSPAHLPSQVSPTSAPAPVLHSSPRTNALEKASETVPAVSQDVIPAVIAAGRHEKMTEAKRPESQHRNGTDALSLQLMVEHKEEHQISRPGKSNIGEPEEDQGLESTDRWLEMLHVGKNVQKGRTMMSFETILLFCALSLIVGGLVWGVFCLWSYHSNPYEEQEDLDKAVRVSTGRPNQQRPVYAQRSPDVAQTTTGSLRSDPPGSDRLSGYPPIKQNAGPQKEPYMDSPKVPADMGSAQMAPMRALCPELIVPRGSECILVVHYLPPGQKDQVEFDILDINGEPVLKVEVAPPSSSSRQNPKMGSQRSRNPTVILKSLQPRETTGGFVFAYCRITTKDDDAGSRQQNVYIYKEDDELYAHLMKDDSRKRYVLTSGHHGLQLLFEGNFEEHVVNVTNEAGERVAATEPRVMHFDPTKYYKLRVAANADVGLVLCGLLMINQMEGRSY